MSRPQSAIVDFLIRDCLDISNMLTFIALLLVVFFVASLAEDVQVTLSNSQPFKFDTNGAGSLDAAFGPIFELNGTYRWIGASSTYSQCAAENTLKGKCGLRSFQSVDLMTWNDEGIFADVTNPAFSSYLGPNGLGLGRPHIIYNDATKLYVLWANTEGAYTTWTSPEPLGPYTLKGPVPVPQNVFFGGDFTVRNVLGSGWISYSAFNFSTAGTIWPPFNQAQVLQELTTDYTNFTGPQYSVISAADDEVDHSTEAADLFEKDGMIYWTGSATCGNCNDGIVIVYRTADIRCNVWTRQIISGNTCGGQSSGVLIASNDVGEKTYVHSADLWRGDGTLNLHGKNVQPLQFNSDGSLKNLDCSVDSEFTFSITKGAGELNTGKSLEFTDKSDPNQLYTYTCDLYENNVYQTWQSSKSGVLKEVGVNLGALNTTTDLQLGVYNFTANSDFLTPCQFRSLTPLNASADALYSCSFPEPLQQNIRVVGCPSRCRSRHHPAERHGL
jgi:hypothetical protein